MSLPTLSTLSMAKMALGVILSPSLLVFNWLFFGWKDTIPFIILGPHLADALISSPVIQGEDGTGAVGLGGMGFDFDPNEDPELALVCPKNQNATRSSS